MDPMNEEIEFDGTATVTEAAENGTQLVPVGTVAGGDGFWLPAKQLPVCGELLGLVLRGNISRAAGAGDDSIWVDVQVVGQARRTSVSPSADHWEAQAPAGEKIPIPVPEGLGKEDVERAEDADFWLFEGPVPDVEIPGHFTDLNGFLSAQK